MFITDINDMLGYLLMGMLAAVEIDACVRGQKLLGHSADVTDSIRRAKEMKRYIMMDGDRPKYKEKEERAKHLELTTSSETHTHARAPPLQPHVRTGNVTPHHNVTLPHTHIQWRSSGTVFELGSNS